MNNRDRLKSTKRDFIKAVNVQIEENSTRREKLIDEWAMGLLPEWAQYMSTGTLVSMLRDIEEEKHPDGLLEALREMDMLLEESFRLMALRKDVMFDFDERPVRRVYPR